MFTIYMTIYLISSIFLTTIFLPKYYFLGLRKNSFHQFLYASKIASLWGKLLFKTTKSTVEVIGSENIPKDETLLIVSNHQSYMDIPALLGYLDIRFGFIAKKELGKIPIFSRWMRYFKCVFIDRGDPRKSLEAIQQSINNIKSGYSQLIFPEGTRSKSNEMAEFKTGSLRIATKTNAVILPVTIDGTYRILGEKLKINKTHIRLIIHKPIITKNLNEETKKNLAINVHDIIKSGLS